MKKILITGNAGMIGTVLTHHFLRNGYAVVGKDNYSGGFRRYVPMTVISYEYDIRHGHSVNKVFEDERPDYVIHCAAYAAEVLRPFIRNFNYSNNVVGSMNIINACVNFDVQKLVNFSSIATYGELEPPFKE